MTPRKERVANSPTENRVIADDIIPILSSKGEMSCHIGMISLSSPPPSTIILSPSLLLTFTYFYYWLYYMYFLHLTLKTEREKWNNNLIR